MKDGKRIQTIRELEQVLAAIRESHGPVDFGRVTMTLNASHAGRCWFKDGAYVSFDPSDGTLIISDQKDWTTGGYRD